MNNLLDTCLLCIVETVNLILRISLTLPKDRLATSSCFVIKIPPELNSISLVY